MLDGIYIISVLLFKVSIIIIIIIIIMVGFCGSTAQEKSKIEQIKTFFDEKSKIY